MTDDGAEGKVANTNVASDETSAANTGSSGRSISNKSVVLDRNGWLAMWAMMVHFDPRHVMRYLWYMGYLGDSVKNGSAVRKCTEGSNRLHVKKAIQFTKARSEVKWAPRLDRSTVRCWVLGDRDSGKEVLLDLFVQRLSNRGGHRTKPSMSDSVDFNTNFATGNTDAESWRNNNEERSVVRWYEAKTTLEEKGGHSWSNEDSVDSRSKSGGTSAAASQIAGTADSNVNAEKERLSRLRSNTRWARSKHRALIVTAIREDGPIVLGQKHRHNECDMAIFVYDDSSRTSFEWCVHQQAKLSPHIPIMYVALNKTFRKAVHAVASTSNNDGGTNGSAELDNRGWNMTLRC